MSEGAVELKKLLESLKAMATLLEKAKADGKISLADIALLPELAVIASDIAKVDYVDLKEFKEVTQEEVKELAGLACELVVAVAKAIKK